MTPHEKIAALKSLEAAWEEVNKILTTTPCQNCLHLSSGYCNLWKEVIPSDILAKGCEKWQFDPVSPPI